MKSLSVHRNNREQRARKLARQNYSNAAKHVLSELGDVDGFAIVGFRGDCTYGRYSAPSGMPAIAFPEVVRRVLEREQEKASE